MYNLAIVLILPQSHRSTMTWCVEIEYMYTLLFQVQECSRYDQELAQLHVRHSDQLKEVLMKRFLCLN